MRVCTLTMIQEKLPITFDITFPHLPCYSKYAFYLVPNAMLTQLL